MRRSRSPFADIFWVGVEMLDIAMASNFPNRAIDSFLRNLVGIEKDWFLLLVRDPAAAAEILLPGGAITIAAAL